MNRNLFIFCPEITIALPLELLHGIFQHLEKGDLKTVSLVCSVWAEATAYFLFDRVFLTPRRKDVEVFLMWSASERCSAAVKEIIVPTTFLYRTLSLIEYSKLLCERLDEQNYIWGREGLETCDGLSECDDQVAELLHHASHRAGWEVNAENIQRLRDNCIKSDASICIRQRSAGIRNRFDCEYEASIPIRFLDYAFVRDGYHEYICAAEEQDGMLNSGDLLNHVIHGLKSLPNLAGIKFSESTPEEGSCPTLDLSTLKPVGINVPPFERIWNPLYLEPLTRHDLARIGWLGGLEENGALVSESDPVSSLYLIVVQAISLSPKKISWLDVSTDTLDLLPITSKVSHHPIGTPSNALTERFEPAYTALCSLRLNFNLFATHSFLPAPKMSEAEKTAEAIRTCLSLTRNLTHLYLRADYDSTTEKTLAFAKIFSAELRLPQLRHLELGGWIADISDFAQFLIRHNLKSLVLSWYFGVEPCTQTKAAFVSICQSILLIPSVRLHVTCKLPDIVKGKKTTKREMSLRLCSLHGLPWLIENVTEIRPFDEDEFDLFDDVVRTYSHRLIDLGELTVSIPGWPNDPLNTDVSCH